MLKTDQCLNIRPGASGSSTIITIDRTPPGISDHRSGGDMFAPSQVYLTGILPPSSNAGDDISMVASTDLSGSNGTDSSPSPLPPPHEAITNATSTTNTDRSRVLGRIREFEYEIFKTGKSYRFGLLWPVRLNTSIVRCRRWKLFHISICSDHSRCEIHPIVLLVVTFNAPRCIVNSVTHWGLTG